MFKLNEWSLSIVSRVHNHPMEAKLEGHIFAYSLNRIENELVADVIRNMMEPRNILKTLKEKRKDNVTVIKQVYKSHQRYKKEISKS